MAKEAGGDQYWVSADGRQTRVFRDEIDSDTGMVTAHAAIPTGWVKVSTTRPGDNYIWDFTTSAWIVDPNYVAPTPEEGTTRVSGADYQVYIDNRWRTVDLEP